MEPYRVKLDVYNGPLDLLLYLIRREELDIYDIPIAHITNQYCQYVEMLKDLDPNLAGEFLVTAATLMEIKSRMLLPTPPPAEEGADEAMGDPRAELVRQLLQYKAFKDAAGQLRQAAELHALRHPRRPVRPEPDAQGVELENVQVWHLLEAFNKVMASIGDLAGQEIIHDDTPIALHAEDIIDRLARDGNMSFAEIFTGRDNRIEVIGLFLALLELIRQKRVTVRQQQAFGEIYVFLIPQADGSAESAGQGEAAATNDDPSRSSARQDPPAQRNLIMAAATAMDESAGSLPPEADAAVPRDTAQEVRPSRQDDDMDWDGVKKRFEKGSGDEDLDEDSADEFEDEDD